MTRYKSAVQKRNAAVLLRKPGRLASQYAIKRYIQEQEEELKQEEAAFQWQ